MNRQQRVLQHINTARTGIEVAPYHNPLLAKADGFNVLTLDVFNTERLLENGHNDPNISEEDVSRIEPVDLVGDASSIAELIAASPHVGNIHYVVSSHNFEHLPNPLKFLRGCAEILVPGGVLSMAVPDGRACFDHYRMPTRLSDWLEAYHEDRKQPSAATIFDFHANNSVYMRNGDASVGCSWEIEDPQNFRAQENLEDALARYRVAQDPSAAYQDAHCSVFFPESMRLILVDLIFLGLLNLELIEVEQTVGLEFFVHLRKPQAQFRVDRGEFYAHRAELLRDLAVTMGRSGTSALKEKPLRILANRLEMRGKNALRSLMGTERFQQLDDWHKRAIRDRRR